MSAFPYTTTSPPPTSGALTVVDKANVSQAYAGGGGGGGSAGPNLALSTLTLNPINGLGVVFPNSGANNTSIVGFQDQSNVSSLTLSVNFVGNYADKLTNGDGLWSVRADGGTGSAYYADFGAGRFIVLGNNSGASIPPPVVDADQNGQMSINAVSTINISTPTFLVNGQPVGGSVPPNLVVSSIQSQNLVSEDLSFVGNGGTIVFDQTGDQNIQFNNGVAPAEIGSRIIGGNTWLHIGGPSGQAEVPVAISTLVCSTINGAPPGGGGGPNPVVSTLTVNDSGNITLDWNSGGGTLNFGFEATNTSSFILQQGIGVVGTKVAGPEGCLQVLEKDGGANQVFAPLQASGFEVCATAYPGGAFAGLYFSSIGSVLYSAVGQPLTIDAPAGVSVSSLTVSSINGAAPGGGGGGMVFSTVTIPGGAGSAFNSDPNVLNQVVTWPIIPNHVYNVNVDCRVQANAPTVTDGDNVYIEVLPNGGTSQAMDTAWGVQVSTLTTNGVWTQVGGSALFKAPVNSVSTCALGILGSFSTTVRVDSITYVDMGAI